MKKRILISIAVLILTDSCVLQRRISKEEAITKAEQFVADQGYSEKRINLDSTSTQMDINEYYLSPSQVSDFRHKTLNPKAVFVEKKLSGWLVAFRHTEKMKNWEFSDSTKILTSAVVMSKNGKKIHMEHQGFLVDKKEILEK